MNATKRKFNALLQGLTSNSHTAASDTSICSQSNDQLGAASNLSTAGDKSTDGGSILNKRRRVSDNKALTVSLGQESTTDRGQSSLQTSSPFATVRRTLVNKIGTGKRALYCPSNRDELLCRLSTFQDIMTWTSKPRRISEIEWARRGWICQRKETVRCLLCHKEVVVKLKKSGDDKPTEDEGSFASDTEFLVDKYSSAIIEAHQQGCLWRQRGCDSSLLRLSLSSTKASLEALRCRYTELYSRHSFLPYEIDLRLPEIFHFDDILGQIPLNLLNHSEADSVQGNSRVSINKVALALALFGWQGLSNTRMGNVEWSASCQTCFRRLGLWLFKSGEVNDQGRIIIPSTMDGLDPIEEHRLFCPWRSAEAQARDTANFNDVDAIPGWKALLQALSNDAHLRKLHDHDSILLTKPIRATTTVTKAAGNEREDSLSDAVPIPHISGEAPDVVAVQDGDNQTEVAKPGSTEAEDEARWARLRRVKSLFVPKGGHKLRQTSSRPSTSQSTRQGTRP